MKHILSATSDTGFASKKQREVMTIQETVELLYLYHRLRSAAAVVHYFEIDESSQRITVKKKRKSLKPSPQLC